MIESCCACVVCWSCCVFIVILFWLLLCVLVWCASVIYYYVCLVSLLLLLLSEFTTRANYVDRRCGLRFRGTLRDMQVEGSLINGIEKVLHCATILVSDRLLVGLPVIIRSDCFSHRDLRHSPVCRRDVWLKLAGVWKRSLLTVQLGHRLSCYQQLSSRCRCLSSAWMKDLSAQPVITHHRSSRVDCPGIVQTTSVWSHPCDGGRSTN